eukprot:3983657-Pyramimonas_sp.AAC.1
MLSEVSVLINNLDASLPGSTLMAKKRAPSQQRGSGVHGSTFGTTSDGGRGVQSLGGLLAR